MFKEDTVTWQLAVMLRTMDIELSVDHMVKLDEEGYMLEDLDEATVEGLVAQQEEIYGEIEDHLKLLEREEFTAEARRATIENLYDDVDQYTLRLTEITS